MLSAVTSAVAFHLLCLCLQDVFEASTAEKGRLQWLEHEAARQADRAEAAEQAKAALEERIRQLEVRLWAAVTHTRMPPRRTQLSGLVSKASCLHICDSCSMDLLATKAEHVLRPQAIEARGSQSALDNGSRATMPGDRVCIDCSCEINMQKSQLLPCLGHVQAAQAGYAQQSSRFVEERARLTHQWQQEKARLQRKIDHWGFELLAQQQEVTRLQPHFHDDNRKTTGGMDAASSLSR